MCIIVIKGVYFPNELEERNFSLRIVSRES